MHRERISQCYIKITSGSWAAVRIQVNKPKWKKYVLKHQQQQNEKIYMQQRKKKQLSREPNLG